MDVNESAQYYDDKRKNAVRDWALRREQQLKLAQDQGGLSIWDKISYAPKNLWSELQVDLGESQDTNYQQPDAKRWDVYEAMMKAASQGQKAPRNIQEQWQSLKNRGDY